MTNHHLLVLSLVALIGAPALARADDKPPAPDKKSEMKPGKPEKNDVPGHDGTPGHTGMSGHAGMPGMRDHGAGHGDMHGSGAMPGMHHGDGDSSAPGHRGYRNAFRELYDDLKEGKLKKEDLKTKLAQLHDTVSERRKQHREEIGKHWGATLALPPAREELKIHARRMAFLNRALVLAQGDTKPDKEKTVERISKLIDKENTRHDKAMARIQSQPATAVAAAPPNPAPPAVSNAAGGSK
jgi:hypothetical protein